MGEVFGDICSTNVNLPRSLNSVGKRIIVLLNNTIIIFEMPSGKKRKEKGGL